MACQKEQVRFLDRDPVPLSLRGKEARVERVIQQSAIVWAGGIRRRVPKSWLEMKGESGSLASDQATADIARPSDPAVEGDDDPITEQAWYSLLEICLELNLSQEDAYQIIAEAAGVSPDELDPSRLTWRQYLQVIEKLEQLEPPP